MAVFKTNDNVEIYYEVRGEGRPLFLLPGWTCTTKFWQKNVEELSKVCKVIAMDMRGHGQSEKVMHSHRISRYAMDVEKSSGLSGCGRCDSPWLVHGRVYLVELYRVVW